MKRISCKVIIVVIAAFVGAMGLCACGTDTDGDNKYPGQPNDFGNHTHVYENYVYNNDATYVKDSTETAHCM